MIKLLTYLMVIPLIIGTLFLTTGDIGMMFLMWGISLFFFFPYSFLISKKEKEERRREKIKKEEIKTNYMQKYQIPTTAYKVHLFKNYMSNSPLPRYLWVAKNVLNIFPSREPKDGHNIIRINTANINFFTQRGDCYNETVVNGGGGGGSSIKGAIVGGVLAGSTGAIIGSRKKSEPVRVENKFIDNRKTIVEYRTAENPKNYIFLDSTSYNILMKIIPEKEKGFN